MKTNGHIKLSFFSIILAMVLSSCCDTSIGKYEPKSQDEREIISLLNQYQDAKNHFDIERYLSLLHDKGEFTFECGRMVSKASLIKELPGFWTEIRTGNPAFIPMIHECINGDYYKSGELNNPRISINNHTAEATVLFIKGISRVLLYVSMIRENDRWLITRTEWGQS
ncbi:MAG: nuclear transport factor 2 family protein [Desulfobacterales bacterium]|nr:nuclear transport factor 2 family protein [Desulfobacterales bacterium]